MSLYLGLRDERDTADSDTFCHVTILCTVAGCLSPLRKHKLFINLRSRDKESKCINMRQIFDV